MSSSNTFKYYQGQIDDWAQQFETPYWAPLSQMVELIEEVGELARIYNHRHGDKIKKPTEEEDDFEGEIGDIIFDIMCIANQEGVDLDAALQKTIDKVRTRDIDRFPKRNV